MRGGKARRRRLGAEELRLWERVAATASPLNSAPASETRLPSPASPAETPRTAPAPARLPGSAPSPAPQPAGVPRRPAGSGPGDAAARVAFAPPDARPVGRPEAGLDRRTAERLRRGTRKPDARIDLHGLTAERAHGACLRFLAAAIRRGDRVVLVITGKGRDGDGRGGGRGVLRASLPGWLRASPLGHSIVGIFQAHRRHGGEGAFYVYLKRHR